jgi:hypothetical protein
MQKENLRNSFLGAIVGQPVVHSKILDTSLNPIKEFESLRKVIYRRGIADLMEEISSGQKQSQITNSKSKMRLTTLETFVGELALHYPPALACPSWSRTKHTA